MTPDSLIGQRWRVMQAALDECQRRLLVAVDAKVLGRGGVTAVVRWPRAFRAAQSWPDLTRLRRCKRSFCRRTLSRRPRVHVARVVGVKVSPSKTRPWCLTLLALVDPLTRGDPQSPLRWTCKSFRTLAVTPSLNTQHDGGCRLGDQSAGDFSGYEKERTGWGVQERRAGVVTQRRTHTGQGS